MLAKTALAEMLMLSLDATFQVTSVLVVTTPMLQGPAEIPDNFAKEF
jgi:hypothetical protein